MHVGVGDQDPATGGAQSSCRAARRARSGPPAFPVGNAGRRRVPGIRNGAKPGWPFAQHCRHQCL